MIGELLREEHRSHKKLLSGIPVGRKVARSLWPLESEGLCAEARRRTGLSDFGDPEMEARLSALVTSIKSEANLHSLGQFLTRMHLLDILQTRLALVNMWRTRATAESIERPIFITGMPRSGSTFLHELLSQDKTNRTPRVWETMFPVAAMGGKTRDARRSIRKAAIRLWWFRRLAHQPDSICPLRANAPHECVAIHSYTLLSHEFVIMLRVPSYKALLAAAELSPVYEWQKEFLGHVQRGAGTTRWVLKSPDHVFGLKALFKVFPDALIVQTHRDPLEVLKSSVRMTAALQRTFARREPIGNIAVREAGALADAMRRIAEFRAAHPELADRFADVDYRELVSTPHETIARLYSRLALPLNSVTEDRVSRLAGRRTRYRQAVHFSLGQLGLDLEVERQRFKPYCLRFGIQQS